VIPGRADRWPWRLGALVIVVGACYANALRNDFVWDDRLTAVAPAGDWLTTRTGAFYRPVVMASFALDRLVWGTGAPGWHATNLACHVGVGWLLASLAQALGAPAGVALAGSLLFVAHPVQTEAVTYVSGRTDVLCALFVLLALLAWRRARTAIDAIAVLTAGAVAAALLSKEAAVAAPLVLLLRGAHPNPRPPRPFLPIAAAAIWLGLWAATGGPGIQLAGLVSRLPATAVALLRYVGLLLWPADLHLERFTPIVGWSAGVVAWATIAVLAVWLFRLARAVAGGTLLLGLAVLLYLPGSGIVPVYPAVADRVLFTPEHFLYLPLLGLAPLVASGVAAVAPRRVAVAALAVVLVAWAAVVVDRNRDWRDEETLFRHTIAYEPPTARVWFNLGNAALAAGRLDEAARLYDAALLREPRDGAAQLNLGITRQRQGRLADAEAAYRAAIANDPRLREAYRGLAGVLAARGALAEAARVLERAGLR
jgi:hypothetical protein